MNRGDLKSRISIESSTRIADGQGGFTINWAEFCAARARVVRNKGNEPFTGGKTVAQQYADFTCHASDVLGVTEAMRVSYDGALWNITSIQRDDEARWVTFTALRGTAQ